MNPRQDFFERQRSARRLAPLDLRKLRSRARLRRVDRPATICWPYARRFFSRLLVPLRSFLFYGGFWLRPDHGSDRGPVSWGIRPAPERGVRKTVLAGLPYRTGRNFGIGWLDCRLRRVFVWPGCTAWQGGVALGIVVGCPVCFCGPV